MTDWKQRMKDAIKNAEPSTDQALSKEALDRLQDLADAGEARPLSERETREFIEFLRGE